MSNDLQRAAYSVLLPAFCGTQLDAAVCRYLERGGVSLLLDGGREHCLARNMSFERRRLQTHQHFSAIAEQAAAYAGAPLLVAVDHELGGIQRLHGLVPGMPWGAALHGLDTEQIEARSHEVASVARAMGINLFLAPSVGGVNGSTPWPRARHLASDPDDALRIACAFIRGVQRSGVLATAMYGPGHRQSEHDPAITRGNTLGASRLVEESLDVLRQLIASGAQAIMPGPAVFPALDPQQSAWPSETIIGLLRDNLSFEGLIIADDLVAVSILRGTSIADAAVAALQAGAHLLLMASDSGLDDIARAVVGAVIDGRLDERRLLGAAQKVRDLARASRAQVDAGLYVSYPIPSGHLTRRVMR